MKNKIKGLFFISFLFSQNFVMTGNREKIVNYCKNNFGTIFFSAWLLSFVAITCYNKKYGGERYWTAAMYNTGELFADGRKDRPFVFFVDTSLITLGCGLLAVNYFSGRKFYFLNNNSILIREGIKIICADGTPLLIAACTEFLGY